MICMRRWWLMQDFDDLHAVLYEFIGASRALIGLVVMGKDNTCDIKGQADGRSRITLSTETELNLLTLLLSTLT